MSIEAEKAHELSDRLPGSTGVVLIEGGPHASNLTHPEQVNGPLWTSCARCRAMRRSAASARPGSMRRSRRSDRRATRGRNRADAGEGVLRLQRAAGNRAVRALLRATLFEGLDATTRARIQTATAPIVGDKIELERLRQEHHPASARTRLSVYGAAVPTDATFRKGLASIAADLLDQKYTSPNVGAAHTNFREDTTVKFAFDFSAQQKGANGVWQFTYVKGGTAGAHKLAHRLPRCVSVVRSTQRRERRVSDARLVDVRVRID